MSKLYIVPTPIGNLDDITLRAVRVLREVDLILAEDTRTSSVLLRHLGIEKRLHAHHKFNEHATAAVVAETIAAGRTVALISDAGTPGISDPGFLLSALTDSKQISRSSKLQILPRYKESIIRFIQNLQSPGGLFLFISLHKNTVRLICPTSNTPSQLMKLCKSEPLCIFYHHHRSVWHIYPYFHYCSRHQHLDFSPCKLFHDPILFLGLHFSMEHSNGDV